MFLWVGGEERKKEKKNEWTLHFQQSSTGSTMTPLNARGSLLLGIYGSLLLGILIQLEGSSPGAPSLVWKGNIKLLLPVLVLRDFFLSRFWIKLQNEWQLPNNHCQTIASHFIDLFSLQQLGLFIKKENHYNKFHKPFLKLCFLQV